MPAAPTTFAESGAPPPWLRALLWVVVPLGSIGGGWLAGGSSGALGGAVVAACVFVFLTLSLEISGRFYGGVRVEGDRLYVGRRSVPVDALDLSTLRFQETADVYNVFGKGQLKSNPMWLKHTVAVEGSHDGRPVQVMVRTNRPDELVAALRAGAAP